MGNDILDLPDKPKPNRRGALLLFLAVVSYAMFWLFSYMLWPFAQFFVLLCSVFLIVFVLEKFSDNKERTIIDYWIFFNVLLFILALTLRSLQKPYGNFVLLVFVVSAALMLLFYYFKKKRTRS